jgi:hypothetical protein
MLMKSADLRCGGAEEMQKRVFGHVKKCHLKKTQIVSSRFDDSFGRRAKLCLSNLACTLYRADL